MNRRSFLRVFGGGLAATATMAEAGMLAEFLDWLKRKPAWSFPSKTRTYDDLTAATLKYITPHFYDSLLAPDPLFVKLRLPVPIIVENQRSSIRLYGVS